MQARVGEGQKASILLVDDDVVTRNILGEFLRDEGFRVHEAENADAARARIFSEPGHYDLLVTDVKMPGSMDGVALATWTARHYPDTEILVISGYAIADRSDFPVLEKPFARSQAIEAVRRKVRHQERAE
jgi:DNA-binding NtrC family response regulator